MYKFDCNDFNPIIDKCVGCDFITERITNKDKICCYSLNPENEWFMGDICPRATHIKKEE
jgi:hypothetical protein